jgi:hypothetical protein
VNGAQDYLRLHGDYCQALGGLRWSASDDALVYADGETFALNEELALFLEGFGDGRRLIHFAFVLHLLELIRRPRTLPREAARLQRAFARGGRSVRNAGAFAAVLARGVPDVPQAIDVREVCDRLRNPALPIRWYVATFHDTFYPVEQPPLSPADFEQTIRTLVQAYTDEELESWFRHGLGPVKEAGEAVARELTRPVARTLTGLLAALLERPRLAGARPLIGQLVSALTLPPRRLTNPELPVGGYADVTTHGQPDQVLPGQFALEAEEFLRRFAERELLYFRREEPHARVKQELVVLLDQGVRTWGDVRLVLSAAALALGKQAARSGTALLFAATSTGGEVCDPLQTEEETLGRMLDASDLTPHPGLALERVLAEPAAGARDVVLLTHTRSLKEADVSAAARLVRPGVRLFAVALDEAGNAELCEMRRGAAVKVRQFRVDFSLLAAPPEEERTITPPTTSGLWQGHVEPIPFPFRFGVCSSIAKGCFDFDYEGDWLLTASRDGMLHAWRTEGGGMEVLPRPMVDGQLVTHLEAVVGVAGGFVLLGRLNDQVAVVHYDFRDRTCTAYGLDRETKQLSHWELHYARQYHSVIAFSPTRQAYALDLGTGDRFSSRDGGGGRVKEAFRAWERGGLPARRLLFANALSPNASHGLHPLLYLDPDRGRVHVHRMTPAWEPFTPQANGRPALKDCQVLEAQCSGTTLALLVGRQGLGGERRLWLFQAPQGIPVGEYSFPQNHANFVLSPDGKRLARQLGECTFEGRKVDGDPQLFVTRKGGFSQHAFFVLGPRWLLLRTGKYHAYLARWDRTTLELEVSSTGPESLLIEKFKYRPKWIPGVAAHKRQLAELAAYDPKRFVAGAETTVIAVGDRFGQVAIFDKAGKLVCMFFAFAAQVAVWMPDGTCYGPAPFTGSPPTPGALEKIGRALRQASEKRAAKP